ncbi:hypothetical protein HDU93_004159 [Gonapodya sp. JEL0774]|nr:hypothetical protein HDU93_004159 [Gonapodya sp. JEL0774]
MTLEIRSLAFQFPIAELPEIYAINPRGSATLGDPTIGPKSIIVQVMRISVFDPSGGHIGVIATSFSVQNLCSVLDDVKSTLTPMSLLYIFVRSQGGQVLAVSGLGNQTAQQETLISNGNLRSIFNYSYEQYPLLNISLGAIYNYTRGNLSQEIKNVNFQIGEYMFQATSKQIYGFNYYIVTGAPTYDFLGDTIYLSQRLQEDGIKATLIMSFSAVALVLGMSFASVIFTWIFITRPLQSILGAIEKAIKFDFSYVRAGSIQSRSIVHEIRSTQDNFLQMLQVFANALKQNKELVKKTSTSQVQKSVAAGGHKFLKRMAQDDVEEVYNVLTRVLDTSIAETGDSLRTLVKPRESRSLKARRLLAQSLFSHTAKIVAAFPDLQNDLFDLLANLCLDEDSQTQLYALRALLVLAKDKTLVQNVAWTCIVLPNQIQETGVTLPSDPSLSSVLSACLHTSTKETLAAALSLLEGSDAEYEQGAKWMAEEMKPALEASGVELGEEAEAQVVERVSGLLATTSPTLEDHLLLSRVLLSLSVSQKPDYAARVADGYWKFVPEDLATVQEEEWTGVVGVIKAIAGFSKALEPTRLATLPEKQRTPFLRTAAETARYNADAETVKILWDGSKSSLQSVVPLAEGSATAEKINWSRLEPVLYIAFRSAVQGAVVEVDAQSKARITRVYTESVTEKQTYKQKLAAWKEPVDKSVAGGMTHSSLTKLVRLFENCYDLARELLKPAAARTNIPNMKLSWTLGQEQEKVAFEKVTGFETKEGTKPGETVNGTGKRKAPVTAPNAGATKKAKPTAPAAQSRPFVPRGGARGGGFVFRGRGGPRGRGMMRGGMMRGGLVPGGMMRGGLGPGGMGRGGMVGGWVPGPRGRGGWRGGW